MSEQVDAVPIPESHTLPDPISYAATRLYVHQVS